MLGNLSFSLVPRRKTDVRIGEIASGPGGIDSRSFIEFRFKIEEEFGVIVSDDDLC